MKRYIFIAAATLLAATGAVRSQNLPGGNAYLDMAVKTFDSLYQYYSAPEAGLLRENYPFDEDYRASYVSEEEQGKKNPYAFLWPYSETLSATAALYEAMRDKKYLEHLENRVLPGLEKYLDKRRDPAAYASYIHYSDRYYDDNIWVGIDFTDLYLLTRDNAYLEKAEMVWKFIESGMDDKLGGGIYWCEQKKTSKNTCSCAPGTVYAMKLYYATGDKKYLDQAIALYEWTKKTLQDTADYLYYDNISVRSGRVDERKFPYNSGQMMQAAVLLYKVTEKKEYLKDAQDIAASAYNYFFYEFTPEDGGEPTHILRRGSPWFSAVMFRGFLELYNVDGNRKYVHAFGETLAYAWEHARDERGLFPSDFSGRRQDRVKGLLTQGALVEMFARMAHVQNEPR